jgi:phosphate acetyltransferase
MGIMEVLLRHLDKVAFFRPLITPGQDKSNKDNDIVLLSSYYDLGISYKQMYAFTNRETTNLISLGNEEQLFEGIFNKYKALEQDHNFILCEGTDYEGSNSAFEVDINAEIANNLGCPVLLVATAHNKTIGQTVLSVELALDSFSDKGCDVIAVIVNRAPPEMETEIQDRLKKSELLSNCLTYIIPDEKELGSPTVKEIAGVMKAEILYGSELLDRHVHSFTIAAMHLPNFLARLNRGTLVITPGDRSDIIVACLSAVSSLSMPSISGIMLTGGLKPEAPVRKLIEGFARMVPILSVKENTFPAARKVDNIHSVISPDDKRKIARTLELFEKSIDVEELSKRIISTRRMIVTPKMFEYQLEQRAKQDKQHIVLPEGTDERILRAAEILLRRDMVDITLLGDKTNIQKKINLLGLRLNGIEIIDPRKSACFDDYVSAYYNLRQHKGISPEIAEDTVSDLSFFGTLMVYKGQADGMVSGAIHTTSDTIRPALQIIKTKTGFSIVSSLFFMCLKDRVLAYGDCAVNPDPNALELAEIAVTSALTSRTFGIEPRVAMLSYSTGQSGQGADVEKVREAVGLAKQMAATLQVDLKLEGPIQYDAAIDPEVARIKMPDSEVAGRATVFIFPDLNTGNNTYKAVQRSSGAIAVGPVLQGLNKPVNDLSRGCTVKDIVNTIAITAIQAQADKESN